MEAYLEKAYAGDGVAFNFKTESVGGLTYDFSLTCDLAADRGEGTESFADRISAIKRHVLAACFFYYFETVCSGASADQPLKIPYRHNEAIFLKKGKEDQVVVIFSVTFSDKNDWVVAEVFLREFADVRRDPALQTSPAASFSKNVPGELEGTGEEKVPLLPPPIRVFAYERSNLRRAGLEERRCCEPALMPCSGRWRTRSTFPSCFSTSTGTGRKQVRWLLRSSRVGGGEEARRLRASRGARAIGWWPGCARGVWGCAARLATWKRRRRRRTEWNDIHARPLVSPRLAVHCASVRACKLVSPSRRS